MHVSILTRSLITTAFITICLVAQAQDSTKCSAASAVNKKESAFKFSGLLWTRYVHSLEKHVDINGRHYDGETGYSGSSLFIRKARILTRVQIKPSIDATVLVNLADFFGDPKNKVVEIASLHYKYNDHLQLQVGQFRPFFGLEDLYAEDFLQSLDWSNQYYAFGAIGWQSFQMGASIYGECKAGSVPVKYYAGVFNGNGKNQPGDNDNGKLFPARVELGLGTHTKLGLNAGIGKENNNSVWAINLDIDHTCKLNDNCALQVQAEYKKGVNSSLFALQTESVRPSIDDYLVQGFYILPNLKYKLANKTVKSVEFSMRYENINCDLLHNGNVRQTYIPMISTQLAEDYNLRLQLGVMMDRYERSVANTAQYNSNRCVCQLQARF